MYRSIYLLLLSASLLAGNFVHAQAPQEPAGDKKVADQQKKGQPHSDCNVCHGIGHAWLPAGSSLPVGDMASVNADTTPFFYASHIPDAPKRPDWSSAI